MASSRTSVTSWKVPTKSFSNNVLPLCMFVNYAIRDKNYPTRTVYLSWSIYSHLCLKLISLVESSLCQYLSYVSFFTSTACS